VLTADLVERLLEAAVLLAAPWPLWRLLAFRPFRERVPTKAAALAGLLAAFSASIVVMAVFAPMLLRIMAVSGLLAALGALWWLRPGFRRGRRLPPGRLTVLPLAPCLDHRFYQRQAARHGAIFKTGSTLPCPSLRPTACVVGHEQGLDLLRHHDQALEVWPPAPFSPFIPRGFLRYMKQADHQTYSQLFRSAMTPDLIGDCATLARAEARAALSRMARESDAAPSRGFRPRPYLDEMLFAVLAGVFFGISSESDSFARLRALHRGIGIPRLTLRSPRKRVEDAVNELMGFLVSEGPQSGQPAGSGSDRADCLLSEMRRVEPQRADDPTVLGNLIYMLEAGRTDVGGLLMWVLKLLTDHPAWLAALQARSPLPPSPSSAPDEDSLADRVVKETLRLEQSEYLYRRVTGDIEIGDTVIPKGWLLRICIRDGHQNPAVFEHPESFDPDRFLGRKYLHSEYAPFGLFRHMCVGAQLTQVIARTFVTELAQGFDCQAVADGPPEHPRFHWEPSPRFRIRLSERPVVQSCEPQA
jgi:cytochrome P450